MRYLPGNRRIPACQGVRQVSSSRRSLIAIIIFSIVALALTGVLGAVRLAAQDATPAAPHILAGQKPRLQAFFGGDDASFTVSITNTGSIALPKVAVTNATAGDCNRTNVGPLAPGQSTSYICGRDNVTESFLNTLQVTGTAADQQTATNRPDAFVKVLKPELRITKSPRSQTVRQGATANFTVSIFNTSEDIVLTNVTVDDVGAPDCDRDPGVPLNLGPGQKVDYTCALTNVQEPVTTIATMRGINPVGNQVMTASDAAWVEVVALEATLTPQPSSLPEPSGSVTFQVQLINTGSLPVRMATLTTNRFGNVLSPTNPAIDADHNTCLPQGPLPTIPPYGGRHTCSFEAQVAGQPSNVDVVLTAGVRTTDNLDVSATDTATVVITNVPVSIELALGADPAFINPPSRLVNFNVQVNNTSQSDTVTITQMQDEFLGNLDGRGTCDVPASIGPGLSYQCRFSAIVQGQVGQEKTRRVTVNGNDDDVPPNSVSDSDTVTVNIIQQPTQHAFMPSVAHAWIGATCKDATPIALNTRALFLPPPKYPQGQHYFRFNLPAHGIVRVELTNFVPLKGQLQIWKNPGGCEGLVLLGRNGGAALNKTVDLGTLAPLPAGQYYAVQVINDGPTNTTDLYGLMVRFD